MKPSTFIYGWANLPQTRSTAANDSPSTAPIFLLMAASHSPAQAFITKKILIYLYCVTIYAHLMRNR